MCRVGHCNSSNMYQKFMKKIKRIQFHCVRPFRPIAAQTAQKPVKPARPITARARRPHPGRNLGLGRQSALPRAPAWAANRPMHLAPLILIGRPSDRFGRTKTLHRPWSRTLVLFVSLLSLFFAALSSLYLISS